MERRIQDYLAGRLSSSEAEEFEARMFADDELAAEVERALEIRAAMQEPLSTNDKAANDKAASNKVVRRTSSRLRPAWALAAGVAALALGLTWLRWQPPLEEPVFRGAEQRMGVEFELTNGTLNARWPEAPGAKGYELQFYAVDGQLVHSVEAATAMAKVNLRDKDLFGAAAPPSFVEVVALDEFGQTLMRSERLGLDFVAPDR